MFDTTTYIFISGVFVAAASGLIGSFLVLRKMTLLSDALSHVALPGIALGIMFHFDPLIGGFAFLMLAVLLIWQIEHHTKLSIESVTGVLFVTALAIGSLLIPQQELLEAFFGTIERLTSEQIFLQTVIALVVIVVTLKYLKPLLLASIAPELASVSKISQTKMELLLLTLITLTITIGINFVGVLLMSALLIVPAATARNISKNFKSFLCLGVLFAIISLLGGLLLHLMYGVSPGAGSVLIGTGFFILSFLKKLLR